MVNHSLTHMLTHSLTLLLSALVTFTIASTIHHNKDALYPENSLMSPGSIYNFAGESHLPASRVHHTVTFLEPYVIVYGGVSPYDDFLDDLQMYDMRYQSWSGEIERKKCCNREEKVVETLGIIDDLPLPGRDQVHELPIGFQGGIPAARAEHAVASDDEHMYLFGGVTEMGLMQDFFTFDPKELRWTSLSRRNNAWPVRRAGHNMEAASGKLYLFGGRATLSNGMTKSLNDMWVYDIATQTWTESVARGGSTPAGRQHAASTIFNNELWIFGGLDSSSQLTYNDLWSFHLVSHIWTQRHSPATSNSGFIPPPLHHAHLIPSRSEGILVYGGIGNGGSCGGAACGATSTVLGQVYRFDIAAAEWSPSRLYSGATDSTSEHAFGGEWEFGRISSDFSADTGGTGKFTKTVALERVAVSRDRNLLFEFGGVIFNQNSTDTITQSDTKEELWEVPFQERSDHGKSFHEAGGVLANDPWDLYTGEQLRETVDIPLSSSWWYNNLPSAANRSDVSFQNVFRQFSVVIDDVVLLSTVESSLDTESYIPPAFKSSDFTATI